MNYIFDHDCIVGRLPIKNIQIAWYDMENGGSGFDEEFIKPEAFGFKHLMYVSNEDDAGDLDQVKVFVNSEDGRRYEIKLERVIGK